MGTQPSDVGLVAPLGLADSEHLGAAARADTLGRRLSVLHGYGFGVLHFLLGFALDAVGLHVHPPVFAPRIDPRSEPVNTRTGRQREKEKGDRNSFRSPLWSQSPTACIPPS